MLAVAPQDPYNMERVFWLLLGRDGASVKAMMEEFQRSHRHSLSEEQRRLVPAPPNTTCTHVTPPPTQTPALTVFLQLSGVLSTGAVSDEGILETMRRCWEENLYLLCPHTAVAVWHHYHCPHSWGVNRSDLPSHFL